MRNLIDKARETTEFFNYSQKGNNVELFRKKLQDMCRTDWVSGFLGFETFLEFYETLVKPFEEIYHNEEGKFNQDSVKKADFNH